MNRHTAKGTAKEIAGQARRAVARRRRDPAQVAKGINQEGEGKLEKAAGRAISTAKRAH
jgi:hypothetical protein